MKYFFISTSLIIIFSLQTKAQIQKGAILLGGSISFNSQDNNLDRLASGVSFLDENETDFLSLQPQAGIFVSESLLLGIGLKYEYQYIKDADYREGNATNFFSNKANLTLYNAYIQKFFKLTDNFFFSPTLNVFLGSGTREIRGTFTNRDGDLSAFEIELTPGLTYFVSEKWAATARIGELYYRRLKDEKEITSALSTEEENVGKVYGLNFGLNSFAVGVRYFLRNNPE